MSLQHVQQQDHRCQWQQPQPRASLAAPAFPTAAAGKEPFPGATLEPFPGSKEPFPGAAALEPFAGSGDSARKNQPPAAARSDRSSAAAAAQGPSVSESRWQTVQVYLFATSSLYGGQLFWLGAWTAVDVDMVVDLGLPESHLRDWLLVVVGFSVLLLLDRWYEEAGIPGSFWFADEKLCGRWELPLPRSTSPAGKLLYILTTVVTLACSTAFWVGIFNLVDDYGPAAVLNSTYAYVSFVAGGFVMMILTGTEKTRACCRSDFLLWKPIIRENRLGTKTYRRTQPLTHAERCLSLAGTLFESSGVESVKEAVTWRSSWVRANDFLQAISSMLPVQRAVFTKKKPAYFGKKNQGKQMHS